MDSGKSPKIPMIRSAGANRNSRVRRLCRARSAWVDIKLRGLLKAAGYGLIHQGDLAVLRPEVREVDVWAEGVKKVVIVSDEPDKYPPSAHFPPTSCRSPP